MRISNGMQDIGILARGTLLMYNRNLLGLSKMSEDKSTSYDYSRPNTSRFEV